jgi:hypothetical protein
MDGWGRSCSPRSLGRRAVVPGRRLARPPAAAATSGDAPGGFTRESFVLCPALEPHRDELATLVGFKQNPDRALAVSRSECVIRGQGGNFARVALLPALVSSIQPYAESSFDAPASPAPELGADAMFVDGVSQPHVVFSMGRLFIDVNAENLEKPSREKMIAFATRVREILSEANR